MAHNPQTKARALAMLLTGDAPQYVAMQTGVPYATVKRWQQEAFADVHATVPELAEIAAGVAAVFPDLFRQNGHKKEKR